MASRFGPSSLHQRDSRSALFEGYNDGSRRPPSAGPSGGYGYGYAGGNGNGATSSPAFGAPGGFRSATPNRKYVCNAFPRFPDPAERRGNREAPWANSKLTWQQRGQYSDAVLNELESQNDAQVEGILGKVKILKDVCPPPASSQLPSLVYERTADSFSQMTHAHWRRDSRLLGPSRRR
ncbi:v-SNARE [Verticillium dahliae VdLs.17]|uniref:V-SNARE n=1 Tax=Verticillium dahliae (strain VdLs.17 / ATCC MYA-4575 / FGSC 10137) TaxID=498257 RepID=G2X9F5_VERDV|nr:v-SNARE [Verticillium dahliae VdLs.17]EGY15623.1 v-SNARE [Verticillium dahliae VdLs.17]